MSRREIYLDYTSSYPMDEKVAEYIKKASLEFKGNPRSLHREGEKSLEAINRARIKIAKKINAKPEEIYFNSGGTESNNWALSCLKNRKKKALISSIEHPSVSEVANNRYEQVIKIPVDREGLIDLKFLEKELKKGGISLVSVMYVNNEVGTIQDINKIGILCEQYKTAFHTDAMHALGKVEIDVKKQKIDLLSVSAQKVGGPKGVGFLYIKTGLEVNPWIYGGGQERGLRSGTENVAGILGFAKALDFIEKENKNKIRKLRDRLIQELKGLGAKLNGSEKERTYNNVNVSFPGIDGESLVLALSEKGIMITTGSACSSINKKESVTLRAIGLNKEEIAGSLRLSLGMYTSEEEISKAIKIIGQEVNKLKSL